MIETLSSTQWLLLGLIFLWTGFVRSALGFGGAALSLPLMLLLIPDPLVFLPIIGVHLLVFSSLTLFNRLDNVDWRYLKRAMPIMALPMAAGLAGLLRLPGEWLSLLVFSITLFYGITYLLNLPIRSQGKWVDSALLAGGGYIAGTSLIGAPLIVAVFSRHVSPRRLRDTLFVLWILFVLVKMGAFSLAGVDFHIEAALLLLPIAAIGHFVGLRAHESFLSSGADRLKRWIGLALILITLTGLYRLTLAS
ncbi:MAG TPA: sulfite exporter TauE/SafE family protein [Gammaproteobacteria bacterium]|nr:sulfite exporter TauE/SafE family protein [Gammaproteobacteria bacterium]